MVGHTVSLFVKTFKRPTADTAAGALAGAAQLKVQPVPTPTQVAGQDYSVAGRIRIEDELGGLSLFVVGDKLRKGAALNAIQIAELLL